MKKHTRVLLLNFLIILGFVVVASSASAKAKVLRFGHVVPARSDLGQAFDWWAKQVTRRSKGEVKVEVYPMQSLVKMPQSIEAVKSGIVDIVHLDTMVFARKLPLSNVVALPTLSFPLTESGLKASGNAFMALHNKFASFRKEYSQFKLVMCPSLLPFSILSDREVRKPADMKGMKFGATGIAAQIAEQNGGVPVKILPPEAYMSMERSIINGTFTNWGIVLSRQMQEVATHFTEYSVTQMPFPIVMNLNTWNSLSPEVQRIINDLASEVTVFYAKLNAKVSGIAKMKWQKKGNKIIKLTPAERKRWEDQGKPMERQWLKEMEAAGYDEAKEILDYVKQLRAEAWAK